MILQRLLETEKAAKLKEMNKYMFVVDSSANKAEIAREVEKNFSVKVMGVNINRRFGKNKRAGKKAVSKRTPLVKIAIITLASGGQINIA